MDLKVEQFSLPSTITANWDEIKNEIAVKLKDYSVMTYTEDEIGRAKADKAYLNKLKKSINDERIRLEREYMRPFEEFKNASKEVMALIDEPIAEIDKQLKSYEEKRKEQKQLEIGSLYVCAEFPSWVRLNMIQNDKWLNATYKLSDIKDELEVQKAMIENNVKTLEGMPFGFEALEEYKRTLDLNQALKEGQRLADIQKRKAEEAKKKAEAEAQKAQEEAEKPQTINKPTAEEKPTEEPQAITEATWRTFGGFFTDSQFNELKKWLSDRSITIATWED